MQRLERKRPLVIEKKIGIILKCIFSLHKDTTPPQPNHAVTPTHIEPEQYNT